MEGGMSSLLDQSQQQQQLQPPKENLNHEVVQLLNLEALKTRALSLYKAISRIFEDFDAYARTNATPKWQDILGQYSMVNLELFNIVEEVKKVSKAFVVHPKNINAQNATILPVMLSSKLLPEMEIDENSKKEQLLQGMQNLPIPMQIEKLKARIDMIGAACESAEKVLADTRKAYCFGTRQGLPVLPTMDKGQAAKIQEQENLLRAAVNYGEGLKIPVDQRQITSSLPMHLADVLPVGDGGNGLVDSSGIYVKNTTPPLSSNNISSQGTLLQASGAHLMGRSAASPGGASVTSFDNTTSPFPYANSPRSGNAMMNTPSPQQQSQQQIQQQNQQQRQKMMQLPQHQQLLAQQQFRQSSIQGLTQNQLPPLHDLQSQAQQKFQSLHGQHQMQFSQSMGHQQFQSRQLPTAHLQHGLGQGQLNQANQLNRNLNQFSGNASGALFTAAQGSTNTQMIQNMPGTVQSQSILPRMQFGLSGSNQQRSHATQILSDQMFNIGATSNQSGMMPIQSQQQHQQQHSSQGSFGNMQQSSQNLQSNMVALQNASQNHPNFGQQRQQNQQ